MTPHEELVRRVPREAADPVIAARAPDPVPLAGARDRSVALLVVLILACVLGVYWRTTLSMVAIWERSETFAHGFVVIPIFCYLLWRKRDALNGLTPVPCWGALLGIVAAGFAWLTGELVNAASISQLAMVAMVPFAVWTVLGTRIATTLLIPLAFLFFAVPFGEFLVPMLMDWTAHFTVVALRASGVPVYQEGTFFTIPSGMWSVVEACSGLRYLIASLMVGCLYAYLSYRSPVRRAAFIAASLVVPIIANWMRAYMIVMLAYLSSNRLAVGIDHLIYGWIFFGLVMVLLLWIGSRWQEDDLPRADPRPASEGSGAEAGRRPRPRGRLWIAVVGTFIGIAIWQPLLARFDASENSGALRLAPIAGQDGWTSTPDEISAWRPDLTGFRAELRQTFAKDGQQVGLHITFYRGQSNDAKAISSVNQLVSGTNKVWRQIENNLAIADLGDSGPHARAAVIVRPAERLAVWQWYWVDGRATSNAYEAKLLQALSVLRGHGDSVAWVVIYVPDDNRTVPASESLRRFAVAMRRPIEEMLQSAASSSDHS